MNLREMTTAELREWLAEKAGYERSHKGWHKKGVGYVQNPFPATLDGAAAAMPEGWDWYRAGKFSVGAEWIAVNRDTGEEVRADDTGNEIADRYLLAKLATEAQTKGNE